MQQAAAQLPWFHLCTLIDKLKDESRWNEYLDWLTQRVVKTDQVLRPIVKTLL